MEHVDRESNRVNGVDDTSMMFRIPGWSVLQVSKDITALFCQDFKGTTQTANNDSHLYIEEVTVEERLTCVRSECKENQ